MASENNFVGDVSITEKIAEPIWALERDMANAVERCGRLVALMMQYTEEVMGADTRPSASAIPGTEAPEGLLACMRGDIGRLHDRLDKLEHIHNRLNVGD